MATERRLGSTNFLNALPKFVFSGLKVYKVRHRYTYFHFKLFLGTKTTQKATAFLILTNLLIDAIYGLQVCFALQFYG